MKLSQFIQQANLDWKNMYLCEDQSTGYSWFYPLNADEFLQFAKTDLLGSDTRGFINALTNAKRAIDCQADCCLSSIGFQADKLEKQLGSGNTAAVKSKATIKGVPFKFQMLEVMGIVTPTIVTKMRRLRNALEHEYRKPRRLEAQDAVDIAQLFLDASGGRMRNAVESFGLGSGLTERRGLEEMSKEFHIKFECDPKIKFMITYWDGETLPIRKTNKGIAILPCRPSPEIEVNPNDEGFIALLRLIWNLRWDRNCTVDLKEFLTDAGVKFPKSRLRVR